MPESTPTFKCLGHTKRDDDTIASYTIEVTSSHNNQVEVFDVEPRHLLSAKAMKTALLNRCMFYSTTQTKHTETIAAMFDSWDAEKSKSAWAKSFRYVVIAGPRSAPATNSTARGWLSDHSSWGDQLNL